MSHPGPLALLRGKLYLGKGAASPALSLPSPLLVSAGTNMQDKHTRVF